ncbi:hypothetical protein [Novosphingobium sp.]|uniref:hypothetical protein n=1 Tax=Novosphingobium sp. TaxID=1874826 RepID=UPI00286EA34E|nr:hypothetical protein [Novosphingobium sp.]
MIRTFIAIAALLTSPAAALAKPAAKKPPKVMPLNMFEGAYRFTSTDFNSVTRKPVCTETWTFTKGKLAVESGQEQMTKTFRTIRDRTGDWLAAKTLSSNGKPDCTGNVTTAIDPRESRIYLLPMNSGDFQICPPPSKTADGIPLIGGCYGSLRRIANSDHIF